MDKGTGKTRGRLVIALLTLAVVGGVGYVAYRVYNRGLQREGMFDRAERALRDQKYPEAIGFLREALGAEPGNVRAREYMLIALDHEGKLDEAAELAREWSTDGSGNEFAARMLCTLAIRRFDYPEAERLARSLAETQPDFAYHVIALLQDHRGIVGNDLRQRLEAAQTMRSLASVTQNEGVKAEALVFSSAITLEVLPDGQGRTPRIMERVHQDLQAAILAATQARQKDGAFPYELVMARIRILSQEESETSLASETLRKYVTGINRNDHGIADLALHHLRKQEWTEVVGLMRELRDNYLWQRVYSLLSRTAPRDIALEVLESGPDRDRRERRLARADLLMRGEKIEEREAGRALMQVFLDDPSASTADIVSALQLLAMRLDLETARAAARQAALTDRGDLRLNAFLATLLASSEEDKEEALALADQLASETESLEDSREMMRLLGGQGAAFERYIESQVAKGGEGAAMHRLSRALGLLSRSHGNADTEEGAAMRDRVRKDLEALLADPTAKKSNLVLSFQLAALVGAREMAGSFLGRALAMPGEPEDLALRILEGVNEIENRDALERLAQGVADVASSSAAPAFVRAFGEAVLIETADRSRLPELFEKASSEAASRLPALTLAAGIAFTLGDMDAAGRHAQTLLEVNPEAMAARDIVAASLLREKKWDDVLRLYEGVNRKSVDGYARVVGALVMLERKDEALALARESRDLYPAVPLPYAQLAQLYIDRGMSTEALRVLSIAPNNPYILHLRADLLLRSGDYVLAAQLFESLLVVSTFRDKAAWTGLYQTLLKQSRLDEFQALGSRVLAGEFLNQYRSERAQVHVLRGMAFETNGQLSEALSEYENAVSANAGAWEALNNAAWHIAQLAPTRVEVARGYIEKALEMRPDDATILDTAAEVYSVSGDVSKALEYMDAALAKASSDRLPKFTLHKGMILKAAGRTEEMEVLLKGLAASHPDDASGKRAKELLWDIAEQLRMAEQAKRDAEERAARQAASPPEESGDSDE